MPLRVLCILIGALLIPDSADATHNRAGEITYQQIGDLTIRVTITTYTKTSSVPADRDSLELFWGDGTSSMVRRSNGNGFPQPNDIKINYYIAEHTYPGRATYTLSMMDPNRIGGINNVNPPNSDAIPFYLETTFTFLSPQFQGFNSSPILLQAPLDFACVGRRYIHNPNAYDPDGDSLSYELAIPFQDKGVHVPNYLFPDQINPGATNQISLDPVTGDFVWDAPPLPGIFNIAFWIHEYRNGIRINSMLRDMQIIVLNCDNEPPRIFADTEYCVVAGDTLEFDVLVTDPDAGQLVSLTMLGGPLEISDQVTLSVGPGYMQPPFTARFRWITRCDEISNQHYTVVFKAVDNGLTGADTTGLADLKAVRIKVVGPPPENVSARSHDDVIRVTWESPYRCEVTKEDYFRGFSVWRKEGSRVIEPDTCRPGLEGQGYVRIAIDISDSLGDRYFFDDFEAERGRTYCYRVLGEFARLTPAGQPYNRVMSLPSNESCVQLNRDIPMITHVTVNHTDAADGEITVRWIKPLDEALDTLIHPGPYRFELMHSTGIDGFDFSPVPGGSITSPTFSALRDTFAIHLSLNTRDTGHNYRVNFYSGGQLYDTSPEASSVFLTSQPTDQAVRLTWDYYTPWNNQEFEIFREDPAGTFVLIGTTTQAVYLDTGLENGREYCYVIQSIGSYGIDGIPDPLLNMSQETCAVPEDDVPPCAPLVEVRNICHDAGGGSASDPLFNTITWKEGMGCNDPDIAFFHIYFAASQGSEFIQVGTVNVSDPWVFTHAPDVGIAGCYALSAIDFAGNESAFSEVRCVENCPLYTLPNAFTPNGDGHNDIFIPFPYRFVERIDMKIFNRWGQLVFKTTDPDIRWDGTNLSGQELADGTYHYVCHVYEQPQTGGVQNAQVLTGFIELLRGRQ